MIWRLIYSGAAVYFFIALTVYTIYALAVGADAWPHLSVSIFFLIIAATVTFILRRILSSPPRPLMKQLDQILRQHGTGSILASEDDSVMLSIFRLTPTLFGAVTGIIAVRSDSINDTASDLNVGAEKAILSGDLFVTYGRGGLISWETKAVEVTGPIDDMKVVPDDRSRIQRMMDIAATSARMTPFAIKFGYGRVPTAEVEQLVEWLRTARLIQADG